MKYYSELISNVKSDVRKTWTILNELIGKTKDKSSLPDTFIHNDKHISDPKQISNDFCSYFSKVGENFANAIPPATNAYNTYLKNTKIPKSFYLSPTDPYEVDKILTEIKPKKVVAMTELVHIS